MDLMPWGLQMSQNMIFRMLIRFLGKNKAKTIANNEIFFKFSLQFADKYRLVMDLSSYNPYLVKASLHK